MSFLDDLLSSTRLRIDAAKQKVTEEALEQRIASQDAPRGFAAALRGTEDVAIIAEIKRATPSKGALDLDLDAGAAAAAYADGGAAAISVLTEPEFFKGSLEDLDHARGTGLPVLQKDFVLDPFQVLEARAAGADAVLLIVRTVGDDLGRLRALVEALSMDALVEIHHDDELDVALDAGARLIGINHRDLSSFEVDPERTAKVAARVPDDVTLVALSGISTRAQVEALRDAGAHAVLVGEALVRSDDPARTLRELRGVA
ncbi:MAG TPA: indole-3-glycerol phosphate synthase TrpC [Actinomycetota bacterium]|nr:indole-3-glycerol phosphate synthase TrpC [Actinomycetota bacterium]